MRVSWLPFRGLRHIILSLPFSCHPAAPSSLWVEFSSSRGYGEGCLVGGRCFHLVMCRAIAFAGALKCLPSAVDPSSVSYHSAPAGSATFLFCSGLKRSSVPSSSRLPSRPVSSSFLLSSHPTILRVRPSSFSFYAFWCIGWFLHASDCVFSPVLSTPPRFLPVSNRVMLSGCLSRQSSVGCL